MAAVDHGADALYVGGPAFGARAAAGNGAEVVEKLVDYAHRFGVRVYAALNTLIFNNELAEAESVAREMIAAGVDALIVQDMALRRMGLEGVEFHASTQVGNTEPADVAFLAHSGFSRAILERGLTLDEIRAIRAATDIELECFVHGAICVGISGRCFLSRSMGARSGNRGNCMQACRLPYTLYENGCEIIKDKYLLSPLDLDLTARLGELVEAGVTSFKIEGRLKDAGYVKNIVSHYRQRLDELGPRASSGRVICDFEPDPRRSFSRGATEWTMGSGPRISLDTPKSTGPWIGNVAKIDGDSFILEPPQELSGTKSGDRTALFPAATDNRPHAAALTGITNIPAATDNKITFSPKTGCSDTAQTPASMDNIGIGLSEKPITVAAQTPTATLLIPGDGICFAGGGTYVNAVDGRRITPNKMDGIVSGMRIYRNFDKAFDDTLTASRTRRVIDAQAVFDAGMLTITDNDGFTATASIATPEPAHNPSRAAETLKTQLAKTGDTIFNITNVEIVGEVPFMPISAINTLRRTATEALLAARLAAPPVRNIVAEEPGYPFHGTPHNVVNRLAEQFYRDHGVTRFEPPRELMRDFSGRCVMESPYCLRREIGRCGKPVGELSIRHGAHTYRIDFDCQKCRMKLIRI